MSFCLIDISVVLCFEQKRFIEPFSYFFYQINYKICIIINSNMFNYAAQAVTSFSPGKVLGGADVADSTSYRTLFCGPDPADPERVLVRKILELSNGRYAYEETTITPNQDAGVPSVHTTAWKIHGWDMKEELT